ncbi:AMP-binding protein [Sagittula stellata]|uniref:AMP-binding enzyme family protein n=1 Tax=Sagittula stellata (strain ATCC 700073 / DSM 11524 / E-37) TaxID=388399 RepID=A3K7S3_SAGS3|nr:AMP-binding protein [Sagittula stellata]EBA06695.1 AMP-binding enzyme family protein [Sagittula stellata E-37]
MNTETIFTRFSQTVARQGDAAFLHVLDETAKAYDIPPGEISYADMADRVERWRERLAGAGYGTGHRVGLLLENRPVFLEIWLALNALGASVVPINPDLRLAELEYLAEHSEMILAIVLPSRLDEMEAAVKKTGLRTLVTTPDGPLPQAIRPATADAQPDTQTECALLYTSGTTGKPKGCILSNEYYLYSGDWYAEAGGHISLRRSGERMLTPLPVFHMNAMAVSVMAMITVGGCLILLDRFHPRSWWASVRDSGATVVHYLGVMPPMLMRAEPSEEDRNHSVRFGFGAGVEPKLHAPFEERYGFPLIEAWACTETGSGGVICANEEPRKIGTACFGRPSAEVEVRVVDDTGQDVPPGSRGEMLVRRAGDNSRYGFFSGYLKNQEATDALWQGGWLHTGDVVQQDEDGALHFVDRKKNVIRRSGENISAVEVESILGRHPEIASCAAAAAPDDVRGDEVAAFVILDGAKGNRAKAEEIVNWALDQMAYYKAPGWIAFVDALPLTATQKILRGQLKDLLVKTFEADGFIDTRHLKKRKT